MKPTKGKAEVFAYAETAAEDDAIGVTMLGGDVADCTMNRHRSFDERKSNAILIADAFNTYHATGLTPSELAAHLSEHKAARIAYASEFPPDDEGEPDVGSIHANIRELKVKLKMAEESDAESLALYRRTRDRADEILLELSQNRAARIAYASEFPPDAEGEPDVGNIHANIRALKAQRDELLAALESCAERLAVHMKHSEDLIAHMQAHKAITNATKGEK